MFTSALKSFSSNIQANYTLNRQPTSISGPWKIYDGKNKSTGKEVSVFVFDRRSLEGPSGNFGSRSGGTALKRAQDEVVERLKKEASSLARLRHPSILELTEPVEETRHGGLMFATEPVTASLAGLLRERDDQERSGGSSGRPSQHIAENTQAGERHKRDIELDELEIQKGLIQVGKGLEFLHESAHLVHGNLTPEAIFVNAKSDWKISGLGFSGPPDNTPGHTPTAPISLSEVLHYDPRLPRSVQLDLDYCSPDFVLDSNVTTSADLFSLGLLIIALYNSPHKSPVVTNSNPSTYKKIFSSAATVPSPANNFLSSKPLSKDLSTYVLPRLITRRPAQRCNAREFQQSQYFDNILVSTIRFLESLPAKTPNEKSQFLRGLPRILNQFPVSVLEKKLLPALLDEMKDRDLLSLILQDMFKIIQMLPGGERTLNDKVIPALRETFLTRPVNPSEREPAKEAGLMVLLENIQLISEKCSGKRFQDDLLPMILLAIQSQTHAVVDAALKCLPIVLSVLDFSTIKNEVFPIVAAVFSRTNSLGIKVRGLEAFVLLCGGSISDTQGKSIEDELGGNTQTKSSSTSVLDKYTVQEKVVPLLKSIKTKEPAVMIAALKVFQQVGTIADYDFLATEVLPILWAFSLGPLLNLQQFQQYMNLIKILSSKIEKEQMKKLQELSSHSASGLGSNRNAGMSSSSLVDGSPKVGNHQEDFERLVLGRKSEPSPVDSGWGTGPATKTSNSSPWADDREQSKFSWSTPSNVVQQPSVPSALSPIQSMTSRAITPDQTLNAFATLMPANRPSSSSTSASSMGMSMNPLQPSVVQPSSNWLNTSTQPNPWSQQRVPSNSPMANLKNLNSSQSGGSLGNNSNTFNTSFSIPAPPSSLSPGGPLSPQSTIAPSTFSTFNIAPPPQANSILTPQPRYGVGLSASGGGMTGTNTTPGLQKQEQKQGIDAYESLL
ncbi:MAG: hypothetical protein M1834_001998 [Cirrosporium novae-zelandiae]|nr:MAG: hypothetical protein M1834_001998 [Cirrosporium novae-zelandiae]